MEVVATSIADVLMLKPRVLGDARGFFFESYNRRDLARTTGLQPDFVQDNHSRSAEGVLRGLHYQIHQPQGKLIRVVAGEIFDVAVDLRRSSPTFGQWVGEYLSAENRWMMWIPIGFAHGFVVTSDYAEVVYKVTDYYAPEHERCICWDDPTIAIQWPLQRAPLLSLKDMQGIAFEHAEVFE